MDGIFRFLVSFTISKVLPKFAKKTIANSWTIVFAFCLRRPWTYSLQSLTVWFSSLVKERFIDWMRLSWFLISSIFELFPQFLKKKKVRIHLTTMFAPLLQQYFTFLAFVAQCLRLVDFRLREVYRVFLKFANKLLQIHVAIIFVKDFQKSLTLIVVALVSQIG